MTREAAIKHRLAFNALADGATIEMRDPATGRWTLADEPCWLDDWDYRARCNMTLAEVEDLIAACMPDESAVAWGIAFRIREYFAERGAR